MKAKIEDGEFVLRVPVEKPFVLSKSGKSRLVATTRGIQKTSLQVNGKTVHVVLNAFINNQERGRDRTDDDD